MDPGLELWMLSEMRLDRVVFTITPTPTVIYTRNPNRYAITLPIATGYNLNIAFGDQTPTGPDIPIAGSVVWVFLNRHDVGELIAQPIWLWTSTGSFANTVTWGVYYDATRRGMYDAWIKQQLSQYRAP